MAIGDVSDADDLADVHYVDTGMYDVPEYGAVYLIDSDRPALVDAGIGTNYERILDAMDAVGIGRDELAVIALTHVHLDHAGGAGYLARECPNAEVAVHGIGAPHLEDPERLVEGTKRAVGDQWAYYTEPEPIPGDRIRELGDGDVVDLGDRVLDVHHAPGHAPHQVVFHDADAGAVFTGDAAGIWVPSLGELRPTSPPPNFDLEQCLEDAAAIADLDPEVLCYPHFGPAAAGGKLDRYRSVLTEWIERVDELREVLDREEIVTRVVEGEEAGPWGPRKLRGETEVNVSGALHYLERASA